MYSIWSIRHTHTHTFLRGLTYLDGWCRGHIHGERFCSMEQHIPLVYPEEGIYIGSHHIRSILYTLHSTQAQGKNYTDICNLKDKMDYCINILFYLVHLWRVSELKFLRPWGLLFHTHTLRFGLKLDVLFSFWLLLQ